MLFEVILIYSSFLFSSISIEIQYHEGNKLKNKKNTYRWNDEFNCTCSHFLFIFSLQNQCNFVGV